MTLILASGFCFSARAKIVGILFDTSGSMVGSDRLPSFGMQLLAGTIDGRAGHDRVVLMNFNAYVALISSQPQLLAPTLANIERVRRELPGSALRPVEILTGTDHQRLVDQARRMFVPQKNLGTPYGPIEVMLATLAEQAREGEPAYLVIVSDGEYNEPGLPDRPDLPAAYRAYKERFPAGLRVDYLFIKPQDRDRAAKLLATVEAQGVRNALLDVFNDGAKRADGSAVGAWTVSNGGELWDALRAIIASVSGTDLATQRRFVRHDGHTVHIRTPLSIARVVAVSTAAADRAPAEWQSSTLDQSPTAARRITAEMGGRDAALGVAPMHGLIRHFWFQNAVSPGEYEIAFDRAVADDVFLLFQTQAVTDIRVFDADGNELGATSGHPIRLLTGRTYTFQAQMFDDPEGGENPVDLASLPGQLAMTLRLSGGGAPGAQSMIIDTANNRATTTWTPRERGAVQARSQAAIPGFLSPVSPVARLEILDTSADIAVSPLRPTADCEGCSAAALRSQIVPNGPDVELATFSVTANGDFDGAVRLDAEQLPDYVEIRTEDGLKIAPGSPVPMAAGATRTFSLWRLGTPPADAITAGSAEIALTISPGEPWVGQAETLRTSIALTVPKLSLRLVAVAEPIGPGALDGLKVNGSELLRGDFYAQFALENAVVAPDPAGAAETVGFSVDGLSGGLIGYTPAVADPRIAGILGIDVRPAASFWCLCFVGIENWFNGSARRAATVSYADHLGVQSASRRFALALPVPVQQLALSCAVNLLYLLLAVMFLRGLAALIRTNRFPRNAVVEIQQDRELPRFQRLRGNNYTWLRAWLALFAGDPHEVRTVQGLRLTALGEGASLDLPAKTTPPWLLERMGQTFSEMKEQSRDLQAFRLIWGDRLEHEYDPGLTIRLKRSAADD